MVKLIAPLLVLVIVGALVEGQYDYLRKEICRVVSNINQEVTQLQEKWQTTNATIAETISKLEENTQLDRDVVNAAKWIHYDLAQYKSVQIGMLMQLTRTMGSILTYGLEANHRVGVLTSQQTTIEHILPPVANRLLILAHKELFEATKDNWHRMDNIIDYYRQNQPDGSDNEYLHSLMESVRSERLKLNLMLDDATRVEEEKRIADKLPIENYTYHRQYRKFISLIDYITKVALQIRTPMDTPERVNLLREYYVKDSILDDIDRMEHDLEGTRTPWNEQQSNTNIIADSDR